MDVVEQLDKDYRSPRGGRRTMDVEKRADESER